MQTRSVATVFGGSGFIGRYLVRRLAAAGYVVRIAVRDPEAARFLMTAGRVAQVVPLATDIANEAEVARAVQGAELVVNLVGILAERRPGDFDRVHAAGAGRIASCAAAAGVRALVHVSAIGAAAASTSAYARSKAAGEAAVRAAFPAAIIMRPSVVFGPEDGFFNRFGAMAAMLPFMPVLAPNTKLQPVFVGDVAAAIMAALTRGDAVGATYELGGPTTYTMRQLMRYVLNSTGREKQSLLTYPLCLMRTHAWWIEKLCGLAGMVPPLTRDQLNLLGQDNVVAAGMPGLVELGIAPTPIELVVPDYLVRFRQGGRKRIAPDEGLNRA